MWLPCRKGSAGEGERRKGEKGNRAQGELLETAAEGPELCRK